MRDNLHEKAKESRHNEMFAYSMFITGAIFFVGGVLETVTTTSNPTGFSSSSIRFHLNLTVFWD